jgi:hypothetical protein
VGLLGLLQCTGKPLAIPKYIQAAVQTLDDRGGPEQVSEEWGEEDGLTRLLPEDGGDWWDVGRQKDPPEDIVAHLVWRWSLFESPVCFFYYVCLFISVTFIYPGKDASLAGGLLYNCRGP